MGIRNTDMLWNLAMYWFFYAPLLLKTVLLKLYVIN